MRESGDGKHDPVFITLCLIKTTSGVYITTQLIYFNHSIIPHCRYFTAEEFRTDLFCLYCFLCLSTLLVANRKINLEKDKEGNLISGVLHYTNISNQTLNTSYLRRLW